MQTTQPKLIQKHEFYIFYYEGVGVYCRIITDNLVDKKVCEWDTDEDLHGLDKVGLEKHISKKFGIHIARIMSRHKSKELKEQNDLERNQDTDD